MRKFSLPQHLTTGSESIKKGLFSAVSNNQFFNRFLTPALRKIAIISFITFVFSNNALADYTILAGNTVDASAITPALQTGTLYIYGTLIISTNVFLSGFTAVVVGGPSGTINWTANKDLKFSAGITFDVNNPTPGLQPTGGSAAKSLTIGSTTIAVSNDNSNNAAYSFAEFNAAGGLVKFSLNVSPTSLGSVCYGTTFSVTISPTDNITSFDCSWSVDNGAALTPASHSAFTGSKSTIITPIVSATPITYTVSCTLNRAGDPNPIAIKTITVSVNKVSALPTLFSVTGGGNYCSGGIGVAVGLSGSQSGVNYQLYNGAATVGSAVAGTGSAISFGSQTSAGTYTVVATNASSSCTNNMTGSATVSIKSRPSSVISTTTTSICNGGSAVISVALTGTANWSLTYFDGITSTVLSGITSSPKTFTVSPSSAKTYTIIALSDATGCASIGADLTGSATVGIHNLWTGETSIDWNTASNWSDGLLPSTSCPDVIIQNVSNKPILSTGSFTITNLVIESSAGLNINGNGQLKIGGNITNGGTFDASAGNLEFNGTSPQSIAGTFFVGSSIKNLTISNTSVSGLTLTGAGVPLNILGDLDFGTSNATLTTNDNLVLRSTAATTARVTDITNNGTYTGNKFIGKVTVERFYPGNRSWRLATAPLSQTGNIFNSWQNGGNYVAGKGMFVTGTNPDITTNGLDNSNQNNFSMKGWDGVGNVYTNIADTKSTLLSGNSTSAANVGYFTFVRGDRSRSPDNTFIPNTNSTTLSSTGFLQTGTQTFTATPGAGTLSLIGNPYASPVDFSKITRNNVLNRFTAWDPLLNDVGGFVVFDDALNTGTYTLTTGTLNPGGMDKNIQSSQAFFVQTAAAGPASVVFNEPNKSSTNHLGMFRPASPVERKDIRIKLNKFRPDNSMYLADALYAAFDDEYSPDVTFQDAPKFGNINETFGLLRNNHALTIERRPVIKETDTLFLKLTKSVKRKYRFEIEAGKLTQDNLAGFIEDKFLNQLTPVNLEGNTSLDFEITADAASAAADRFKIIFRPSVVYTNIKASMLNSDIAVEWNLPNEYNIKEYEIEHSTNGINFTKTATIPSKGNSDVAVSYQWLDIAPATGEYYYRIRSISYSNVTGYSNKARVTMNRSSPAMYVFPNPVTGNSIQLQMNSMPQGVYAVRLINNLGQAVVNRQVMHGPGTAVEKIQPAKKLLLGLYHLEVLSPDKKITMIKVNMQ